MRQPAATYPGGTILSWATQQDGLGNTIYVGLPVIIGPHGETLPEPLPPVYAKAPAPKTTTPSLGVPGSRIYNEHAREGIRLRDNGVRKLSTGALVPSNITGWDNAASAKKSDNVRATTQVDDASYTPELIATGFDFSSIPENAVITGIKVSVERSKVPS